MTDTQWMIVLHVTLLVLQALVAIVQYLLTLQVKEIKAQVHKALNQTDVT